jgi:Zn-dependent M28 family amino/carboxypeptidase
MKHNIINYIFLVLGITMVISCSSRKQSESINAEDFKQWVSAIASDDFQGRFPATTGEERTINYLADQFKIIGAMPANGERYFQEVPLIQIRPDQKMKLMVSGSKEEIVLNFFDDFIGGTPQPLENIDISNAELVYVGYGINAPEFSWNDYSGIDVKGKVVLALVNDPGFIDSTLFNGMNMTYYGRWIYKFEEAAKQGAAGIILIHETNSASYPWSVVQNSWSGARFYLANNIVTTSGMKLQSWVSNESAKNIFKLSGRDYDTEIKNASTRGFKSFDLNLRTTINLKNTVRFTKSNNVVALIPGTDLADEYIIYTAHWDHFGINNKFQGDSILNGALDNATGTAALLSIAKAFMLQKEKPRRSILFMATTCEEQGLLGSQYYAENPIYPLNRSVAVINMDALNIFGRTKDMNISGYGFSELDEYAKGVLKEHNRYASFSKKQSGGGYYRSDHFSFSKVGVPTMNLTSGGEILEPEKKETIEKIRSSISETYHKPSDNYNPNLWSLDGMVEDLQIYFELGYKLSSTNKFPSWHDGVIYKAKRDKMMKQ